MMYDNAPQFHTDCQSIFAFLVKEGFEHGHAEMQPSHLCVRSETLDDFAALSELGGALGETFTSEHAGRNITWIKLATPLLHDAFQLNWLEITQPDPPKEQRNGPQMLVFAQENFGDPVKEPSRRNSHYLLRYQAQRAEDILGLVPTA